MMGFLVLVSILGADIDSTTIVITLVSLILGGGLTGAILPMFKFRTERDSAIAVGAEAAVASLTAALARSDKRIDDQQKELANCNVIIGELKAKLEEAYTTLKNLTTDLESMRKQVDQLPKQK